MPEALEVVVEFSDTRPNGSLRSVADADVVVLLRSDGTYHVWKDRQGGVARRRGALVDTTKQRTN